MLGIAQLSGAAKSPEHVGLRWLNGECARGAGLKQTHSKYRASGKVCSTPRKWSFYEKRVFASGLVICTVPVDSQSVHILSGVFSGLFCCVDFPLPHTAHIFIHLSLMAGHLMYCCGVGCSKHTLGTHVSGKEWQSAALQPGFSL